MKTLQWWCVAQGEPWSWSWQAYPGVWLVVIGIALLGRRLHRLDDGPAAGPGGTGKRRARGVAWIAGTLLLWAALDWPVGPLGASYLASVHVAQFLMVGLVAPALLLLGVPASSWRRLGERRRTVAVLRDLTHPLAATLIYNAGMTLTHWPAVVDGLRVSQLGSFALDAVWLACGLVFWWPLIAPVPAHRSFQPVFRMGYLFVNGVLLTPPALMLLFSRSPLYAVYELAPPIRSSPVIWDQQLAGALMKLGSAVIMGVAIVFVVRGWIAREGAFERGRA